MKTKLVLLLLLTTILGACKNEAIDPESINNAVEKAVEKRLNEKLAEPYFPVETLSIKQDDELINISTSIIKRHAEGDLSAAFEIIRSYSPLSDSEFDAAKERSISQLEKIANRFGDLTGYEFITSKKIGKAIVRHDCIVKYRLHIVRWVFVYYRAEDKWILNTFKWDDNIHALARS
jgi:hypothetical protein